MLLESYHPEDFSSNPNQTPWSSWSRCSGLLDNHRQVCCCRVGAEALQDTLTCLSLSSLQVEVSVSLLPPEARSGYHRIVLILSSAVPVNWALVAPEVKGHVRVYVSYICISNLCACPKKRFLNYEQLCLSRSVVQQRESAVPNSSLRLQHDQHRDLWPPQHPRPSRMGQSEWLSQSDLVHRGWSGQSLHRQAKRRWK